MGESRVDWTVPNAIEPTTTGYLVTENGVCQRCGDQNSDDVVCLTCTNPSDPNSKAYWSGVLELLREQTKRVAELERRLDGVKGACEQALRISSTYDTSIAGTILAKVVLAWLAGLELAKPVLLDVSRDPGQHPRDETGRYAAECREMPTRRCPRVYGGPCGDRPCARFESDDPTLWAAEAAETRRRYVQGGGQ